MEVSMFFRHMTHSTSLCRFHGWLTALLAFLLLSVLPAPRVQAASLTVNSLADANNGSDGVCTLREAITAANNNANFNECISTAYGNDTITFSVGGTITLGSSLPNITDAAGLTIEGGSTVTISGNNAVRVFQVNSSAALALRNLVVANGNAGGGFGGGMNNSGIVTISNSTFSGNSTTSLGGGLYNDFSGTATINNSTFFNNSADFGGGIRNSGAAILNNSIFSGNSATSLGGGIYNSGTVTISNTTFSGTNSSSFGGGLNNGSSGTATISNSIFSGNSASDSGGGIYNSDTVTISNSTFSNNSASNFGGGIYNSNTATIGNSTFSGNSAVSSGGAILNSSGNTVTISNSIVANSLSGGNCTGSITNGGHNLDSSASCGWGSTNGSLSNINPQLGPLANNGGPTQTHALTGSSPAINAGNNALIPPDLADQDGDGNTSELLPFDQRGSSFPRTVGGSVDIGAFEVVVQVYLPIVLK
jgi:CSLREA domain-containing protein